MASIDYNILKLEKRVPLTIARGTRTHSPALWLRWSEDGIEGWGEAVEFGVGDYEETLDGVVAGLSVAREWLEAASAQDRQAIERRLRNEKAPLALVAAVNQALLDWTGKSRGESVMRVLGLPNPESASVTSVTVGIMSPDAARERVRRWRELGEIRAFKIKLGSPRGIAADQAMFKAVRDEVGAGIRLSVDANGGWSVADACRMSAWLADRDVDHLEQPLARGQESDLQQVRAASPLPVFVDESCFNDADVAGLTGLANGINIKLMKCGGLDEALRMIATARSRGLRLLVGCYGNTALGNTAAATLASRVDYLDLDSHLNLKADPFKGVIFRDGRLELPSGPGFGITHE